MKRARLWMSMGLLALTTAACGQIPKTHYYVLDVNGTPPAAPAGGRAIGVEPFHVDPPYDQDRVVYRVGAGSVEVGFYAYHRWAVPLSRMLPTVTAAALGDSAGVKTMEPARPGHEYAARLRGRLLVLEEVDTPAGASIRARLQLVLHDAAGEELWMETADMTRATTAAEVGEMVEEMRSTLMEALGSLQPGLEAALRR